MNKEDSAENMAMALGMATFQAQGLEYALVSLQAATALNKNEITHVKLQELMDTRYKYTLGRLIKETINTLKIPEELQSKLEEALQKRNWVTHHFFREYGGTGFNPELQNKAVNILNEIWPFFEQVSESIQFLTLKRIQESGKTEEEINSGIERALREYNEELKNT